MKLVRLIFNSQFCGSANHLVYMKEVTIENIKKEFINWIGIEPDENCSWMIVG